MKPDLANMARAVAAEAALRQTARQASERDPAFCRALFRTLFEFGAVDAMGRKRAESRAAYLARFDELWAYLVEAEGGAGVGVQNANLGELK